MQADNGIAYQYLLCNVQCTSTGLLDVIHTSEPSGYRRAQVANIPQANGSAYNCYVASSLDEARAAVQAMVRGHPLGARERVVLCKIMQRSVSAGASVASVQAVPPTGLPGMSQGEPTGAYMYTVHRHVKVADALPAQPSGIGADAGPRVASLAFNDVLHYACTLQQAHHIASSMQATQTSADTVLISRIESSTTTSVPSAAATMLEAVPAKGMPAYNSHRCSYLVLRCQVQPDGRLDVMTSPTGVQALAFAYVGGTESRRNVTLVRDCDSIATAVEREHAHLPLADRQCLLVCKIEYVSQMLSAATTASSNAALHTEHKAYRYLVHRHDATATGALKIAGTEIAHWPYLRGDGMYLAETADEANRIVAQQCAAEPRAVNQLWLVSCVESVPQRPVLVFVAV